MSNRGLSKINSIDVRNGPEEKWEVRIHLLCMTMSDRSTMIGHLKLARTSCKESLVGPQFPSK